MTTFKAYAVVSKGKPLEPWTYTPKPLGDYDVELKVTHNGLCHTDIHMRDNDWGISTFPLIPGHEVVGVVEAVGSKVSRVNVGDRCGFGWIGDSCGGCRECEMGDENLCEKGYKGLIVGNHGGFQERMRASERFCFKIPDALPSEYAAPLMCAGHTVYSPLDRWAKPGMKVGVIAVGGLGHLALQFAHAMGCEVTAFSAFANQEADAKRFGAHRFVDFSDKEHCQAAKATQDLILNTCPAPIDYDLFCSFLRNNGKLVLIGIPVTDVKVGNMTLIFGQKSIVGSVVGGRREMRAMLNFVSIHGIRPQIELMKLSQVNEAMERCHKGQAKYRIVMTTD
eukprot:tig00020912_g15844.t1